MTNCVEKGCHLKIVWPQDGLTYPSTYHLKYWNIDKGPSWWIHQTLNGHMSSTCQHIFSCLSAIHTPTFNMELVTQKRPGGEPHLKPQFKIKFQWCTCQPAHPSTCIHVDHPLHGWIKPWSNIIFGLMKQYFLYFFYHLITFDKHR